MKTLVLATLVVLIAALGTVPVVSADQRDDRLPDLFERLKAAPNMTAANELEQEIWGIWTDAGTESVNSLMTDGMRAMNDGELRLAIDLFTEVVEKAPNFAEGWNKRATAHYLNRDYPASVLDIERTLRLEPRHFGAISGMGLIFLKREDGAGAYAAFKRVLEINPHAPAARAYVEQHKKEHGAI
ncbi:MAG: hypothetical protein AAF493_20855 [Pseudomonadota bacterium]